jgi:hypothetical protein
MTDLTSVESADFHSHNMPKLAALPILAVTFFEIPARQKRIIISNEKHCT